MNTPLARPGIFPLSLCPASEPCTHWSVGGLLAPPPLPQHSHSPSQDEAPPVPRNVIRAPPLCFAPRACAAMQPTNASVRLYPAGWPFWPHYASYVGNPQRAFLATSLRPATLGRTREAARHKSCRRPRLFLLTHCCRIIVSAPVPMQQPCAQASAPAFLLFQRAQKPCRSFHLPTCFLVSSFHCAGRFRQARPTQQYSTQHVA